jgi:hypothetical protein
LPPYVAADPGNLLRMDLTWCIYDRFPLYLHLLTRARCVVARPIIRTCEQSRSRSRPNAPKFADLCKLLRLNLPKVIPPHVVNAQETGDAGDPHRSAR